MALVTAAQLREHIETDLGDDALGRLLNDADAEIVGRYGAHTTAIEEWFNVAYGEEYLFTERPISTITSIVETEVGPFGETSTTIATNDYAVEGFDASKRQVRRLVSGSNARNGWAPLVKVTYTPQSDNARRIRVTIDLVRLAASYTAVGAERVGDVSVTHVDYRRERELLLRSLAPRGLRIA